MAPFLMNRIASSMAITLIATTSPSSTVTATSKHNFLFEETFTSSLSPTESREYLLNRPNWLDIVPEFETGSVKSEDDGSAAMEGAWSMTAENGSHILCTNTIVSDTSFDDDAAEGCFLKYNVVVTGDNGVKITMDIEYDIQEGAVKRMVHGFDTIGLKSKIFKPLIKGPLIELMQEENRRLTRVMNPDNPANGNVIYSSQ